MALSLPDVTSGGCLSQPLLQLYKLSGARTFLPAHSFENITKIGNFSYIYVNIAHVQNYMQVDDKIYTNTISQKYK